MTQQIQTAHIAQRVIQALEAASLDSLRKELQAAELFADRDHEEERSELLGAIAHEMTATLAGSPSAHTALRGELSPHVQLLYHLSRPRALAYPGYIN
jgi:hypothetical protein